MSTIEQTVGDLLSEQDWTGKLYSDGWVDAPETIETTEPATGDVLGTAGVANAASVASAAKSAARAQREWAALPMTARVAILRKAGELLDRHRAEITTWMVRESGCIPRQGGRRDQRVDRPARPGRLAHLASARARAAVAHAGTHVDRAPRADRRRRRDHAVELPDRARDALARARRSRSATRSC